MIATANNQILFKFKSRKNPLKPLHLHKVSKSEYRSLQLHDLHFLGTCLVAKIVTHHG